MTDINVLLNRLSSFPVYQKFAVGLKVPIIQ